MTQCALSTLHAGLTRLTPALVMLPCLHPTSEPPPPSSQLDTALSFPSSNEDNQRGDQKGEMQILANPHPPKSHFSLGSLPTVRETTLCSRTSLMSPQLYTGQLMPCSSLACPSLTLKVSLVSGKVRQLTHSLQWLVAASQLLAISSPWAPGPC